MTDELKLLTVSEFNLLRPSKKWSLWKDQSGYWTCCHCGDILSDGPNRAQPFRGCSVHCGACDGELTRRTGGGMGDPFGWVLVPNNPETAILAEDKE